MLFGEEMPLTREDTMKRTIEIEDVKKALRAHGQGNSNKKEKVNKGTYRRKGSSLYSSRLPLLLLMMTPHNLLLSPLPISPSQILQFNPYLL
jgi:hypothetical protein